MNEQSLSTPRNQTINQSTSRPAAIWLLIVLATLLFGISCYLTYHNFRLTQRIADLEAESKVEVAKPNDSQNQEQATTSSELAVQAFINGQREKPTYLRQFSGVTVIETVNNEADVDEAVKIYVADSNLNQNSLIRVLTAPVEYNLENVYRLAGSNYDYFVAQTQGVNVDFSIFTKDGKLVTQSVRQNNPELTDWYVAYSGYNYEKEVIEATLSKIDDSHGTVEFNPKTGKIVTGTLKVEN